MAELDVDGRQRGPLLTILTVAVSAALSIGLAEGVIRALRPYNTPDTLRHYSLEYDAAVFARHLMKPVNRLVEVDAAKAWGTKPPDEPTTQAYFINEWGYRGPPFSPGKTPGTTRIVVLGGSAVFDQHVYDEGPDTNDWPHEIGRRLAKRGLRAEVINAGVPAHATPDSLGRLFGQLWLFEPDYVLVYHGWNDVKVWHRDAITPENPLLRAVRPYDPDRNPLMSYRGTLDELLASSQLYVKARNHVLSRRQSLGVEGVMGSGELGSEWGPLGPAQLRLNLHLLVDACRNVGAVPILATQGTLVTPGASEQARSRIGYRYQMLTHDALAEALAESNRIVRSVAEEKGALLLDVASQINGREDLFADHVHTTPAGSAELARIAEEFLAERLR